MAERIEGAIHRSVIWLGVLAVAAGFHLPWLLYDAPLLLPDLASLPTSQAVEGWRLPLLAEEVHRSWLVGLVLLLRDGPDDPQWLWLVYLSPVLAAAALIRGRLRLWLIPAHAAISAVLVVNLARGVPDSGAFGFAVSFGAGIGVTALGHLTLALALTGSTRRPPAR